MSDTDEPISSILYVEDEAQYGEIITRLHDAVRIKFYDAVRFDVVPSWAAAVQRVAQARPSVVLLDLALPPDMKVDDTLKAVAGVWRDWPPIVALTGNADPKLRRKCILAGCDSFMLKTVNVNAELLCERIVAGLPCARLAVLWRVGAKAGGIYTLLPVPRAFKAREDAHHFQHDRLAVREIRVRTKVGKYLVVDVPASDRGRPIKDVIGSRLGPCDEFLNKCGRWSAAVKYTGCDCAHGAMDGMTSDS